jgi:hypothetical protein
MNISNHILVLDPDTSSSADPAYVYLRDNFCGRVVMDGYVLDALHDKVHLYLTGDINMYTPDILKRDTTYIIREFSRHIPDGACVVVLGEVPINIHGVGVYFRRAFDIDTDYFHRICSEHPMQVLTESNKPKGDSLRTGIYLSRVRIINGESNFNLLRCSTNLSGATDNFRAIDDDIIAKVQKMGSPFFPDAAPFNHVLAQVYENRAKDKKERKGTIKAHSDKTKDMPVNALMAFTTFYSFTTPNTNKYTQQEFDIKYRDKSVLTQLHFRLKPCVKDESLVKEFSVTLYPHSVFIIPILTNRLYTHEIKPSILPIDTIPTRMGYVIRCSKTEAVYKDGRTHIKTRNGELLPMRDITDQDMLQIKRLYFDENVTDRVIDYGDVLVSMNEGDYLCPRV